MDFLSPVSSNQVCLSVKKDSLLKLDDEADTSDKVDTPHVTVIHTRKDDKEAWIVCVSACLVQALIIGVNHSFGIFYVEFLKEFQCSKGVAAWVGSLAYGLTMLCGILCSPLIERYGHQIISMIGCAMCCVSLITTSFVPNIELTFLTFSLLYGIGSSFSYTATMTLVEYYFSKYITMATGITMAGSSIGTLVMNPLAQALVTSYGWRRTLQILAFASLLAMACSYTFKAPTRSYSNTERKTSIWYLFKDLRVCHSKRYVIWVVCQCFIMFGYYIPYVHLVSYAMGNGIYPETASVLVMVLGASTAAGRIMFGRVTQSRRVNKLYVSQLCTFFIGMGSLLLPLFHSVPALVAYVMVIGLLDGGYVVMLPVLTSQYTAKGQSLVMSWGLMFGICSVPFTLGAPIAGWLVDLTGSYRIPFQTAGGIILIGASILSLLSVMDRLSPPSDDETVDTMEEIVECSDVLPAIEVLKVVSNSNHDISVTTASFDSIVVLGVRNSRQRHNVDTREDLDLKRFLSPTVVCNTNTWMPQVVSRAPRHRTVSVGDQDTRPRRLAQTVHTKDGMLSNINESISSKASISCYSAVDIRHLNNY